MKKETNLVWATMYGGPPDTKLNKLLQIDLNNECRKIKDWDGRGPAYIFIWGWPGPDASIYFDSDYGITWAKELSEFNIPNIEDYICNDT